MMQNGHSRDGITGPKLEEDAQFREYQARRAKYGLAGPELEEEAPFRLVWVDLAEETRNLPPTEWLVPGLITESLAVVPCWSVVQRLGRPC